MSAACCRPRRWRVAGGFLSAAMLALMPKCPACVAAYVGAATGLGLSLSAAGWLRTGAIVVCGLLLAVAAMEVVWRARERRPRLSGRRPPGTGCCQELPG